MTLCIALCSPALSVCPSVSPCSLREKELQLYLRGAPKSGTTRIEIIMETLFYEYCRSDCLLCSVTGWSRDALQMRFDDGCTIRFSAINKHAVNEVTYLLEGSNVVVATMRDPRDVAMSTSRYTGQHSRQYLQRTCTSSTRSQSRFFTTISNHRSSKNEGVTVVLYEKSVMQPENTITGLGKLLGLPLSHATVCRVADFSQFNTLARIQKHFNFTIRAKWNNATPKGPKLADGSICQWTAQAKTVFQACKEVMESSLPKELAATWLHESSPCNSDSSGTPKR